MKTRILSLVLAVVMVVSMAAVFSFSSSAALITDSKATGLTFTVGNTYAAPGTVAKLQVYLSADTLDEELDHVRGWQIDFDTLPDGITLRSGHELYVNDGDAYNFTNLTTSTIGNTSATSTATADYYCATAENVLAKGGWSLGKICFDVADTVAPGEYEVAIKLVNTLTFEGTFDGAVSLQKYEIANADREPANGAIYAYNPDDIATVAGKIIVVPGVEGASDAPETTTGDFVIPTINAAGERVYTVLNAEGDDILITGEYSTFVIPACVTDSLADLFDFITFEKYVLKTTEMDPGFATTIASKGSSSNPVQVYIHKRANGSGTTAAAFDKLSSLNKKKVSVHNILTAFESNVTVSGNKVTVVGGIAVNDVDYSKLMISIKFSNGEEVIKVKEKEIKKVYTTVTNVATTDPESSAATSVPVVEAKYISALSVNGVPSGSYTVEVTVYGWTPDADGCPIVVCSDPVTVEITV